MRYTVYAAALAATTAFATPAFAQVAAPTSGSAEIQSRALILQPATIVAGNRLDFGTVVASNAAGTVTVNPDPNGILVSDTGGATAVTGASRGTFNGNGTPDSEVSVTVTWDSNLLHSSGSGDFLAFAGSSYGAGTFNIRPDGLFTVFVGGQIDVKAGQAPGEYTGKVYVDAQFQ
ncbi:hypothetical protein GCM10022280_03460 [Sphingomonas swuensis]|uniref:DUF4402 domain-containing protein n=1 Tax=Sphingomonas swuensis TaxID=977800 RepID=A0ABP7SC42_9SPHN